VGGECVHGIMNDTEDPWLFVQRDSCAVHSDWRMFMGLVQLGRKQHDTCHLSRNDSDDKKWQTMRTPTLLCCFIFLSAKQHKKQTMRVRRWLLDR